MVFASIATVQHMHEQIYIQSSVSVYFMSKMCSSAILWIFFSFLSKWKLGRLAYGYEYMGLNGRLVITPGTEKVHFATAHAINMQMGCMLNGRENCGKTETIKDLAKICAIFSVIRNCTVLTDFKTLYTIFIGLVQCGGWGILTNFNNMRNSVMDAISMPIHALNMALITKRPTFQVI